MNHLEFEFKISPAIPGKEILIAQLAEAGFDGFVEQENELLAYIPENNFNKKMFSQVQAFTSPDFEVSFSKKVIKSINWNESWEKKFSPVRIGTHCIVRAEFHKIKKNYRYEIIIQPKMAFGTGHHATTCLVMEQMLRIGPKGFRSRKVLDAGCGTGILSILASKLGASEIFAIDNEEWAFKNTKENIRLNHCPNIKVKQADAAQLRQSKYHLILANINKNFQLQNMCNFSRLIKPGGIVLLSGFYRSDIPDLVDEAMRAGFHLKDKKAKNNWAVLALNKR